ncbi:hypothetical protein ACFX2G_034785 [Malus domestica]
MASTSPVSKPSTNQMLFSSFNTSKHDITMPRKDEEPRPLPTAAEGAASADAGAVGCSWGRTQRPRR